MDLSAVSLSSLPVLAFLALGLPLAWQDARESSVAEILLLVVYGLWMAASLLSENPAARLLAAVLLLYAGGLFTLLLPNRLGEADIAFVSGMAALFSFWPLMMALALGCVAGLAAFLWLSRGDPAIVLSSPLPLLPCLYWGGATVILGGLVV